VAGVKQVLLMIAAVALVGGCGVRLDGSMGFAPIVEKAIRKEINKPRGELTKADLEKVTDLFLSGYPYGNQLNEVPKGLEKLTQLKGLHLNGNQLIDVKRLEKLTQLTELNLNYNPALTKAQIAELQKALLKCEIIHNAKK
tara:strand:+ start:64 stop:486 length:423 start_codon:yes stop_codon:yes gene_type:complete